MTGADAPFVRRVIASDRDQWAGLWAGYLAFYDVTVGPEVYDKTFTQLVGDDPHQFNALVAERDGTLIGLTHYLFHAHTWKGQVCYLQDLYSAPEVRGTGVGRALIEAVYAAADAAGVPDVYWLTQEFNHTARRLYDRVAKVTPFIRYIRDPG